MKLFEGGPVTWPAFESTTVGVRNAFIALQRGNGILHPTSAAAESGTAPKNDDAAESGTSSVEPPSLALTREDIHRAYRKSVLIEKEARYASL